MNILGVVKFNRAIAAFGSLRGLARSGESFPKEALVITVHTPVVIPGPTSYSSIERIRRLGDNWVFTVTWRRLKHLPLWWLVVRFIYVKRES
jgi:hypothetical protein